MKILVTGANGLLGHWIVRELLSRRQDVSIIVRSVRSVCFDLSSVHLFEGDFTDYDSLLNAARECDAIIHLAAVTETRYRSFDEYQRVNIEGPRNVLFVADQLNIQRIVFVSTVNTIGYGEKANPATEGAPIKYPFTASFYAQSKLSAEKLFESAAQKPERHVVILHPGFMLGAYDTKPSSGKLLLMGYNKRMMFVPRGGKNFIPVEDVAIATCNALTKGRNGEHYLLTGQNFSFKEYYQLQKKMGKYSQLIVPIPGFILKFVGIVGNLIQKIGFDTDICSRNLNQLLIQEYYSGLKARQELDLPESSLNNAIESAIQWFKARKMI